MKYPGTMKLKGKMTEGLKHSISHIPKSITELGYSFPEHMDRWKI